jgi:hypothetical protein
VPDGESVWCFEAGRGWHKAADPVDWGPNLRGEVGYEAALEAAGYQRLGEFGVDGGRLSAVVYERHEGGGYRVELTLLEMVHSVIAPAVPDLLALLAVLLPAVHASAALEELEERQEERVRRLKARWAEEARAAKAKGGR